MSKNLKAAAKDIRKDVKAAAKEEKATLNALEEQVRDDVVRSWDQV